MGPGHKHIIRRSTILGVLGALTMCAVALASSTSYYNGTTNQKLGHHPVVINLYVSHHKVTGVNVAAIFPNCQNTYQPFNFSQPHALGFAINRSRFTGQVVVRVETVKKILQISGRFKGHQLSGTLTASLGVCSSGKVTYKAQTASGPSL
jgi:hypothetical protein